jgi:O-antigen ligase
MASRILFTAAWLLACLTPTWRVGIYSQWPFYTLHLTQRIHQVGLLALVPILAGITWAIGWALSARSWRWRPPAVTVPVVSLGLWGLARAWPIHRVQVWMAAVIGVAIFWGVYVYSLQNWPRRWIVGAFAALLTVQGLIALAQFVTQGSLGLSLMGESVFGPDTPGASVIEAVGRRWVRAYGLAPHPNVLGGSLTVGVMICLGWLLERPRGRRWLWVPVLLGMAGVLLSFSRGAWLGTGLGLAFLAGTTRIWKRIDWRARTTRWLLAGAVTMLLVIGFSLSGLLVERLWRMDSVLEHNSIAERLRDIGQAWMLIRMRPLLGVGTGYYVDTLWAWANNTGQSYRAFQPVHNILLMAAAEMGVVGALLWLWLLAGPPLTLTRHAHRRPVSTEQAGWAAAFVALCMVGMVDHYLHFMVTWWSAFYLGALCGGWAQGEEEQS